MADTLVLQTTPATPPSGTRIATYELQTFSGDANAHVAPTVLGTLSGGEGTYALTPVSAANPLQVTAVQNGTWNINAITTLPTLANVTTVGTVTTLGAITTSVTPGNGAGHLGKQIDAVAGTTDTGVAMLAIRDDVLTTLVPIDGDYVPLRTNSLGALHVVGSSGTTQYAEDLPHVTGDSLVMMGAVRRDTLATSVSLDGDNSTISVNAEGAVYVTGTAGTSIMVDDAVFIPATGRVSMVGFTADESATDSVEEGDGGAARMTLDRKQIVTDYAHAPAGGTTPYTFLSTAAALSAAVKASPGKVFGLQFFNIHTAPVYARLYNMATAPAITDTPVWRGIVPRSADGAGFVVPFPKGLQFATGIGLRVTAAIADNDATALTANVVVGNIDYI